MKTTLAFFLLTSYLLALCKPVLPLLEDEIAHVFWKARHVATVHHHHGDHHAEKAIAEATHEKEGEGTATLKLSEPVSTHLVGQNIPVIVILSPAKEKYYTRIDKSSSLALEKNYPPPRNL